MSTRNFYELYMLDNKQRTQEEDKRYRLLIKMLRTYNLNGLYTQFVLRLKGGNYGN